jgi:hypothetical protein
VSGALHLGDYKFKGHYDKPIEYVNDGFFALALLGIALTVLLVARLTGRAVWIARAVAVGDVLLIIGVLIGMISGEDPEWFFVLAGPALLLNLFGLILLAWKWWSTFIPKWALIPAALTVPAGIVGGEAGFPAWIPALGWLGYASGIAGHARSHLGG